MVFDADVVVVSAERLEYCLEKNPKVLILHTGWHMEVINSLVRGCENRLLSYIPKENIGIKKIPGCFELPLAVKFQHENWDAVIAIGCLIKGSTPHFEYISNAVSTGLMSVSLEIGKPVIFGVLTCLTLDQAKERAGFDGFNSGIYWADAALDMCINKNT